ncbi:hypothetical protein BJX64DRAFT_36944 [Aspergillus heterothallicus]
MIGLSSGQQSGGIIAVVSEALPQSTRFGEDPSLDTKHGWSKGLNLWRVIAIINLDMLRNTLDTDVLRVISFDSTTKTFFRTLRYETPPYPNLGLLSALRRKAVQATISRHLSASESAHRVPNQPHKRPPNCARQTRLRHKKNKITRAGCALELRHRIPQLSRNIERRAPRCLCLH